LLIKNWDKSDLGMLKRKTSISLKLLRLLRSMKAVRLGDTAFSLKCGKVKSTFELFRS